jgi:hypothetical protein
MWNDEIDITENFEYILKYICTDKYDEGLKLIFSTFTIYQQIKKNYQINLNIYQRTTIIWYFFQSKTKINDMVENEINELCTKNLR